MTSSPDRRWSVSRAALLAVLLVACKTQVFHIYDDAPGMNPPPFGSDAPPHLDAPGPPACGGSASCLVFATDLKIANGNIGGVAGANSICQNVAIQASLPGTYLAWISDNVGHSPATTFTRPTVPYVMVNSVEVAASWSGLATGAGTLLNGISLSQSGSDVTGELVWTGTMTNGTTEGGSDCIEWTDGSDDGQTAEVGSAGAADFTWTLASSLACASSAHFYCFQQ